MLRNLRAWRTMLALGTAERRLAFFKWLIHASPDNLTKAFGVGTVTAARVITHTAPLRDLPLDFSPDAEPQLLYYEAQPDLLHRHRTWVYLEPKLGFFAVTPNGSPWTDTGEPDPSHLRRALGQYIVPDSLSLTSTHVASLFSHFETIAPPPGLDAEPLPDDLSGIRAAIFSLLETFESLPEAQRELARGYIAQHLGLKG